MTALKQKHGLEEQKQHIRRKREQQELETMLAESTIKLPVLQASDNHSCAKASNAMNSYCKKVMQCSVPTHTLDPTADEFYYEPQSKPQPPQKQAASAKHPIVGRAPQYRESQHLTPRPKEEEWAGLNRGSYQAAGQQSLHVSTLTPNGELFSLMQRQNEITSSLVQQRLSSLPARDIPLFDGDPLQYISFIRTFEQGMEEKGIKRDSVYYLDQFTRGQPWELVHICLHMTPELGYEKAKRRLQQHFGCEYKVAVVNIEKALSWSPVKNEAVKALQLFSLFLRGCCNVMEEFLYMQELDMPSNIRAVVSKLPFKLRERWRNIAHNIGESTGNRAQFKDLVNVIERHMRILSDPLYGNISDSPSELASVRSGNRPRSSRAES